MTQRIIISLFCLLVIGGCLDEPDCYQLNNNIVGISFKKLFDKKADTVDIFSITAPGTDSVFYEATLATGVYLPLDFLKQETIFTINSFNQVAKTQQFGLSYSVKSQFVSLDCGVRYILQDLAVTNHNFDSVRMLSRIPSNSTTNRNIEIYRCPQPNIMKIKFKQVKDGKAIADTVSINSIIATDYSWGIGFTTPLQDTQVKIPLNENADITTYLFEFADKTNSLQVGYKRTEDLLFDVCGNQKFISDLTMLAHDFDSIRITKDTIQDPPVTNLEIFH